MEREGMIEDVGGDGLTVCVNATLAKGLIASCVLFLLVFFLIHVRHNEILR